MYGSNSSFNIVPVLYIVYMVHTHTEFVYRQTKPKSHCNFSLFTLGRTDITAFCLNFPFLRIMRGDRPAPRRRRAHCVYMSERAGGFFSGSPTEVGWMQQGRHCALVYYVCSAENNKTMAYSMAMGGRRRAAVLAVDNDDDVLWSIWFT